MKRRHGMKEAQQRMQFMLEYEGLRVMREMQMESGQSAGVTKASLHELMGDSEKTKADGSPVDMLDLIFDKRY